MGLCAHHPAAAKGKCPPKKVAAEFAHKPAGGSKKKGKREKMPYDD